MPTISCEFFRAAAKTLVVVACIFSATAQAAPGDLDPSFNGTGVRVDGGGSAVAIQADGKVVTAGFETDRSSFDDAFAVTRYNADGSLDRAFNGTGKVLTRVGHNDADAFCLALQPDGKIVVGGFASLVESSDGIGRMFALVRYNPDGSLDTSFNGTGIVMTPVSVRKDNGVFAVAVQQDGKIVAAGDGIGAGDGFPQFLELVRYSSDGTLDTSFNGTGQISMPVLGRSNEARGMALQPDGKIVVAGSALNSASTAVPTLVRFNEDGSLDAGFGNNGVVLGPKGVARAVAVQPDGKIVIGGDGFVVSRYNANGTPDTGFGTNVGRSPSPTTEAHALGLQRDGKIIVAGFNTDSGYGVVARYGSDGTLDTTFNGTGKVEHATLLSVAGLALDEEDRAVVVGTGLARLLTDGAPSGPDMDQFGLSGNWYEPASSGQGLSIEFFPDLHAKDVVYVQGGWFTYDLAPAGGTDKQRWFTFAGDIPKAARWATVPLYQNTAGSFNGPPATRAQPFGAVTLHFTSCGQGYLEYFVFMGFETRGAIPIQRLAPNVTCSESPADRPVNADFSFSGNWFNPATSGQGFIVEVNPRVPFVFITWYTYAVPASPNTVATWRWFAAQGGYKPGSRSASGLTIFEVKGGIFDTDTPATQTLRAVGTATLSFQSCTNATLAFAFTDGEMAGRSGTIPLSRLAAPPAGCAM